VKIPCPRQTAQLSVEVLESRELLSNSIVYSAATRLLTIEGTSGRDVVTVSQLANKQIDVEMDHPGSSLPSRHQVVSQTIGRIYFYGGGGTELFQDNTAIPCSAFAGSGNAILIGGSGDNLLVGGVGHDELFGGTGRNTLVAGSGQNALCDGGGHSTLIGGPGADRFLITKPGNDLILNQTAADARINFVGFVGAEPFAPDTIIGTHASWSQPDIQAVDFALGEIEQRVGNTSLLKMPDGTPLTFRRQGYDSNPASLLLGWNTLDGNITLLDFAFQDLQWLHRSVYHEIGHNWEDPGDNKYWDTFTSLSGWYNGAHPPKVLITLYTQAPETDSDWWFKKGSAFTRDYGRTNPWEDWATSVEAYFSQVYTGEMDAGAKLAPAKVSVVNQFLTSKSN
jgi:hypothetical protein